MVTAGTYRKEHHFREESRLRFLHDLLLDLFAEGGWALEAWAVFSNHYHFIARSPSENAESLRSLLRKLHSVSAREINRLDAIPGRKIWHNFRDSHITTEKSHLARLHYVHANAVHHGLVLKPDQYQWCSAGWFEKHEKEVRIRTIYSFPIDRLIATDEF
jgi:putative transposase